MMNAAQEEEEDNSNSSDAVAAATTTTTRTTTTPEEEEERLRLAKDVEKVGAKPCARKVGPFGLFPFLLWCPCTTCTTTSVVAVSWVTTRKG